ncbi:MAG: hypothetical protein J5486_02320 [Bacteroidaceae bacterium]|nr:hypothetical protein [Bacteroidaceae bacterium]
MSFNTFDSKKAGSQEQNEPRLLGSIVEEMLHGNSPLAKGYRQYIASRENGEAEEQGWHANTDLGCDVKTLLRSDKRMLVNKAYPGILRLDAEADIDEFRCRDAHYTFVETLPWTSKRNPRVFRGEYITITRKDDGTLRLNFRPMKVDRDFSVYRYALGVFNELMWALEDLVGKD